DFDLRRLIRIISATEAFQLDSAVDADGMENHETCWAAFPLTRLRPDQVAGAVIQASSLETIDRTSSLFTRFLRAVDESEFVKRYGDVGEDEFDGRAGTIPQRLLLMNGQLVFNKTEESPLNVAWRLSILAPDDASVIETAYLTVLTRRPTPEEASYFEAK